MKKNKLTPKLEAFSLKNSQLNLEIINFGDLEKIKNPLIFDTNFLFITFEFNLDIILEIKRIMPNNTEFYIYEGTLDELGAIEKKGDKNKSFLPLIIKLLKIYNFKIISSKEKYVDDQILSNLHKNIIIATNDKALKQEIQRKGYKVMYSRQKSYLEIQ